MGEANEGRRRVMENLSLQMDKYPRNLLQRLMCRSNIEDQSQYEEEEEDELELNLGLSLGGRFGVDKSAKNKLIRSSSIAGTMPFVRDDNEGTTPAAVSYPAGLMRTSSLPTETEEEWRKRKELQTLRRLEAKRRRSEKQRGSKGLGLEEERRELEGLGGSNLRDKQQQPLDGVGSGRVNRTAAARQPFELPSWAAAARQGSGVDAMAKLKAEIFSGLQGFGGQPISQQGSMESQGGSSSGMSELESSKPLQGISISGEARSPAPASNQLQERSNQDAMGSSRTGMTEDASRTSQPDVEAPSGKPNSSENSRRETRMNTMEDMPCVFTKGDGPNGRKVEGILYRYGKGDEVRIMCVCHGSFLSPAEFLKHAGWNDVAHPLRHIVVNPAATPFL